jgi:hypothetical protein
MKAKRFHGKLKRQRLDTLVLGASPEKLAERRDIVAVKVPARLNDDERVRLSELTQLRMFCGPLTPEQARERELLRRRLVAHGEQL